MHFETLPVENVDDIGNSVHHHYTFVKSERGEQVQRMNLADSGETSLILFFCGKFSSRFVIVGFQGGYKMELFVSGK